MHYFTIAGAPSTFADLHPSPHLPHLWQRYEVYHTDMSLLVDTYPHLYCDPRQQRYIIFFNHPLSVQNYCANLERILTLLGKRERSLLLAAHTHHVYIFPGYRSYKEFAVVFEELYNKFDRLNSNQVLHLNCFTPKGQDQMGVRQGLRNFWLEMLKTQYDVHPNLPPEFFPPPCKALLELAQDNPDYVWKGVAYTNSASKFDYAGIWNDLADNLEDLLDDLDWESYERTPPSFKTDVLKQLVANPPHLQLTTVPCYTNKLLPECVHELGRLITQQVAQTQTNLQTELPATFTQYQSTPATSTQINYIKKAGLWEQGSLRHLLLGEFKILSELCTPNAQDVSLQSKYDHLFNLEQDYIFLISSSSIFKRIQEFFEFEDYVQTVVTNKFDTHKVQLTRANGRVEYMDYATPSCHQVNYASMHQPVAPARNGILQLSEPSTLSNPPTEIISDKYGKLILKTSVEDTLQDLGTKLYPHGLPTQTLAHLYEFKPNSQVTIPAGKKLPVFVSLNLSDSIQLEQLINKLHELRTLHIREL